LSVRRGIHAIEEATRKNLELVAQVTATRLDQLFTATSRMQGSQAIRDVEFLIFNVNFSYKH
jgi:hypothetical protein